MNTQKATQETKTQGLWEKIKGNSYCDPAKRMDFVFFFDVRDGNPNGDPDAGNLPRMDPQTRQGIVTDVCIKRKVRDYFTAVLGRSIYIQNQAALNTLYFRAANAIAEYSGQEKRNLKDKDAVEALLVVLDGENQSFKQLIAVSEDQQNQSQGDQMDSQQSFHDWLCPTSSQIDGLEFDPDCKELSYLGEVKSERDFKSLFTQEEFDYKPYEKEIGELAKLLAKAKKDKKGSAQERSARDAVKRKMCELYDDIRMFGGVLTAGTNAGQIRGPLQLTFARSIDPILQYDAAITRCAITTAADFKKKQTEFGRKPWLNWSVYRQHGFYNPLLGQQTGVTRDDLARFWEALACMFRNSDAASKGEMTMHDIVVFVHNHPRGNAPSHKLFEKVTCKANDSKDQRDLVIQRDGFDKKYPIKVDTLSNDNVKVYRPLRDIWED